MVHAQIQSRALPNLHGVCASSSGRKLTKDTEIPLLRSSAKRPDVYRWTEFPSSLTPSEGSRGAPARSYTQWMLIPVGHIEWSPMRSAAARIILNYLGCFAGVMRSDEVEKETDLSRGHIASLRRPVGKKPALSWGHPLVDDRSLFGERIRLIGDIALLRSCFEATPGLKGWCRSPDRLQFECANSLLVRRTSVIAPVHKHLPMLSCSLGFTERLKPAHRAPL